MEHFSFIEDIYYKPLKTPESALPSDGGSPHYPASGSMVDVSDFERFGFIVQAGALVHAITVQVKQASSKTETGIKDIDDANVIFAATDDQTYKVIEVQVAKLDINNDFRYVSCEFTGGSNNDYLNAVFYGLHKGDRPVTQDTGSTAFGCSDSVSVVG